MGVFSFACDTVFIAGLDRYAAVDNKTLVCCRPPLSMARVSDRSEPGSRRVSRALVA